MTNAEKYQEARDKVEAHLGINAATFAVLPNGKPNPDHVSKPSKDSTPKLGVLSRLEKISKGEHTDATNKKDTPEVTKKKEKKSLTELAKDEKKLDEKKAKAERDNQLSKKPTKDAKKDKDREKDKEDDKKLTPEQKEGVEKQETKMKQAFSKVKLPSGMEIHQEGPKWVLVGKNGARTDITDCMNAIDDYNKSVDAENAAQKSVDDASNEARKKENGLDVNDTNGKVKLSGQGTEIDKAQVVSEWLAKDVKLPNGQPAIDPADAKAIAETALSHSDEKALLEKLKDPKALEDEAKDRDNKNKDKDYLAAMRRQQKTLE